MTVLAINDVRATRTTHWNCTASQVGVEVVEAVGPSTDLEDDFR